MGLIILTTSTDTNSQSHKHNMNDQIKGAAFLLFKDQTRFNVLAAYTDLLSTDNIFVTLDKVIELSENNGGADPFSCADVAYDFMLNAINTYGA